MTSAAMVGDPGLVASFFTLSGAGFAEPPRNSFIERCEAAAAAGFTGIGLHVDDLPRTIAAGVDVTEMQAVLKNNGLTLVEIEFLAGWALSNGRNGGISPALAEIEAVADALGDRQVSADEFTGDTIDLLRRAEAPNAGLLIDGWHFYNGGGHPDQLVDLPCAGITGFQLNDGPLVHDNFQQHARAERQVPGEGELDVVGLIHAARRAGFTGPYCVESNTPEFRRLPVAEAARRAADAATSVLRSAGVLAR